MAEEGMTAAVRF